MAGPRPNKISTSAIKSRLLNLAQTSVYRVKIQPPLSVNNFLEGQGRGFSYQTGGGDLELLCSETSLPGSTLATHDKTSDYAGVTEKFAYRRIYDETIDMNFYVDKNYNVIEFFEGWMDYISGVGRVGRRSDFKNTAIGYRMSYPKEYKTNIYLTKFEKDQQNRALAYTFVDAFPITINSSPVSYNASDIMRFNVSFSYVRYVRERLGSSSLPEIRLEPQGGTVVGVVNLDNGKFRIDRLINGQIISTISSSLPEALPNIPPGGEMSILPVF